MITVLLLILKVVLKWMGVVRIYMYVICFFSMLFVRTVTYCLYNVNITQACFLCSMYGYMYLSSNSVTKMFTYDSMEIVHMAQSFICK